MPAPSRTAPRARREAPEAGPQRRCIVTGESGDRARLMRFVVDPQGEIVPDLAGRLPGRGLWLTARRDIVERAVTKRVFARAARRPVTAAAGLADRVEGLLAQRCCDALGFARRAGLAVCGFERVSSALRAGKGGLLVLAIEGAAGGRRKIDGFARDLPVVSVLTASELGAAFDRDRVVQAAIGPGPLCARLIADAERLTGFRADAHVTRGGVAQSGARQSGVVHGDVTRRMASAPARPERQDGGIGSI
jgi:predicted RNA-binding protein YlxR (DUF448 family)